MPLLSWRVAILPYVEEEALYREFHLDEPWDSPHNLSLLDRMPSVYRSPGDQPPQPHMTFYRVFVGPGTAFERDGLSLSDMFDGHENTLAVVEAGEAVPWTKPDELEYRTDQPLPPLGGVFRVSGWLDRQRDKRDIINIVTFDGWVRSIGRNFDEPSFRALIIRNGGDTVKWDRLGSQ